MSWSYDSIINPDGFGIFIVKAWTNDQGAAQDITFFRGVPTIVEQMTFADPFGDAVAVIHLPQCTGFDGPYTDPPVNSVPSETWWLKEYANIDVYWVPASTTPIGGGEQMIINPLTNQRDMYLHASLAVAIWEGYIVSLDPTSADGVRVQCQGALYQLDRYYAKPLYPVKPKTVESMIERYFDPRRRGLWTQKLEIRWPVWWRITYNAAALAKFTRKGWRYVPTGISTGGDILIGWDPDLNEWIYSPDPNWTGYVTRNSGAWEKALTGYIQGQLSIMYARPADVVVTADVTFAVAYSDLDIIFTVDGLVLPVVGDSFTISGLSNPFDGQWTVTDVQGQDVYALLTTDWGYNSTKSLGTMTFMGTDSTIFTKGDQWTITKEAGRRPVLYLREQARMPEYQIWYGQPGADCRFNRDGNQANNIVYGQGKGVDETSWSKQIFPNGNWSTYAPLSAKPEVWWGDVQPWADTGKAFPLNDLYDGYWSDWERLHGINVVERYITNFPDGIDLDDAEKISEAWLERDSDPGWSGSISLQVDPQDFEGNGRSKWMMKAGEAILVRGFQGTGGTVVRGTNVFHISQVVMNPQAGTVELTVDSKFRDLLTVEEAIVAGRDSLSAIKALQVGKRSAMINDLVMPWNNTAGSGCVPNQSKDMDRTSFTFPYLDDTTAAANRPVNIYKDAWLPDAAGGTGRGKPVQGDVGISGDYSNYMRLRETVRAGKTPFYVPIHAGASNKSRRWGVVPVLLSQAGSIARTEFCAYDAWGNPAEVEFHVSVYLIQNETINSMPHKVDSEIDGGQHAALWEGAFESLDKTTNLEYEPTLKDNYGPPTGFQVGWGTYERPAGYSPGNKPSPAATSAMPTGKLIDGASWDYSFVGLPGVNGMAPSGKTGDGQPVSESAVTGSVAIYVQVPDWLDAGRRADLDWVYVIGRFYRNVAIN